MSQAVSPSADRPYGLQRVTRAWQLARSSVYARRARAIGESGAPGKRGPRSVLDDGTLLARINAALASSPWVGEGYRTPAAVRAEFAAAA